MKKKHSKWEYEQFDKENDFDGDIEEEVEEEEDKIDKIVKKLQSKSSFTKHHSNKSKIKYHKKHLSNSKMAKKINNDSINLNINKNIKEKDYIESNLSNSLISEISNPKTQKSCNNPNPISLEISINSEMKKNLNDNNNNNNGISPINPKPNVLVTQNIKNIFDTINNNTTNSIILDNSEFLLNKLKGNKLLQEMKLKQNDKNKFSYYGKESNKSIDTNENNNRAVVFNIIDNKNNMNENLNKSTDKNKKIKYKKRSYLNRKINNFYFRYVFNCNFSCYCKKCCRRNTRFNTINLIRNIFIFLVIFSAIGFYSIIFFYN